MQTIQFMQDGHERRFDLLWRRLKSRKRQDAAMLSMLYLATAYPQILERFSDYFFPDSGEFFDREFLAERFLDSGKEAVANLLVQLYNGRTTITIIELIERSDEQQMMLVLEAIKLRKYGISVLERQTTKS